MLLLLFAVVTGITLLNMTEDSKPTASMLGDSVIESEVKKEIKKKIIPEPCLLYTSPSPRDLATERMPSSA